MASLGLWTPYVGEPLQEWYPQLPGSLAQEYAAYRPDGHELDPLPEAQFRRIYREAVRLAERSVAAVDPAYHNPEHFDAVENAGLAMVEAYERLSGQRIPRAVVQALQLALRLHDCAHPGATFRADSRHPLWKPELGTNVSVEWVSALLADELAQRHGLPVPWRWFIVGVILASTFGGATPRGRGLQIPMVQPRTLWGCIMRVADVAPPEDRLEKLQQHITVLFGEIPAGERPASWTAMVDSLAGFLDYMQYCLDQLDAVAGVPLAAQMGWPQYIVSVREWLPALYMRSNPRMNRAIEAQLAQFGFTLPN